MSALKSSTLRPGLLVSLKTSVVGNAHYERRDIEKEHVVKASGASKATWETERTISDPVEYELAHKARSKARAVISVVCAQSAFGLLCPESRVADLERAIAEAHRIENDFNSKARLTRLQVYVMTGRIAPDDMEAVKAIKSECRDLLDSMRKAVGDMNVEAIRRASKQARSVAQMLQPESAERIQIAIDTARKVAREIVKAGEQAEVEVDKAAMRKIREARTAFLDLDAQDEVKTTKAKGRAIDLPTAPKSVKRAKASAPAAEL